MYAHGLGDPDPDGASRESLPEHTAYDMPEVDTAPLYDASQTASDEPTSSSDEDNAPVADPASVKDTAAEGSSEGDEGEPTRLASVSAALAGAGGLLMTLWAAVLACPSVTVGAARRRPRAAACCFCCLLVFVTIGAVLLVALFKVLVLVCTELGIVAVDVPTLCASSVPVRFVVRLVSYSKAHIMFTDPYFDISAADGTTLIDLSVMGSCLQQLLDAECASLADGTIARRRGDQWHCFQFLDGYVSPEACVNGDGEPFSCVDAAEDQAPLARMDRHTSRRILAGGCVPTTEPPSPPPSPPAASPMVYPEDGFVEDRYTAPGCLQRALNAVCGRSESGVRMHARRALHQNNLWGCFEKLVPHIMDWECIADGTADRAACRPSDRSDPKTFSFDKAYDIASYVWSLDDGHGHFRCPDTAYHPEESPRRHSHGEEWGEPAGDPWNGTLPEWATGALNPPRVFHVSEGTSDNELLFAMRVPNATRLGMEMNDFVTFMFADLGITGNAPTSGVESTEGKHWEAPPEPPKAHTLATDINLAPRFGVRIDVRISLWGWSSGLLSVRVHVPLTQQNAHRLRRIVSKLQRQAGCAECNGIRFHKKEGAPPLITKIKMADTRTELANQERTRVHGSLMAKLSDAMHLRIRVPAISLRLCSNRPWQADSDSVRAEAVKYAHLAERGNTITEQDEYRALEQGANALHAWQLQRRVGGCIGTAEVHPTVLQSNAVNQIDSHILLRYDGTHEQRLEPLHAAMKISNEHQFLLGGSPDSTIHRAHEGDPELAAFPVPESACVFQRLLDELALHVDLHRLVESVVHMQILPGMDNEELVDDLLDGGVCAVGLLAKNHISNFTAASDERELRGYCARAISDAYHVLTSQVGHVVVGWVTGKPQQPVRETHMEEVYLPVGHNWGRARLDSMGIHRGHGEVDAMCRGHLPTDDSPRYYREYGNLHSVEECTRLCTEHRDECSGVEYNWDRKRCELWLHEPHSLAPGDGYGCFVRTTVERDGPPPES
eukprot:CAMPEP_0185162882 /NCGR_PEP_ID=MMETSP1139-20130426/7154_1 /TAXON_ID=298111 /ORGANISM="Pavlova sp., Strain CCMP459" /LENGTH=1007 /DNA_ID=CAMNT_0027728223 /DNA_START=15 /DNA_END=3038 /DNA_ORIENTATION=+